jgi:hypothetical protein
VRRAEKLRPALMRSTFYSHRGRTAPRVGLVARRSPMRWGGGMNPFRRIADFFHSNEPGRIGTPPSGRLPLDPFLRLAEQLLPPRQPSSVKL